MRHRTASVLMHYRLSTFQLHCHGRPVGRFYSPSTRRGAHGFASEYRFRVTQCGFSQLKHYSSTDRNPSRGNGHFCPHRSRAFPSKLRKFSQTADHRTPAPGLCCHGHRWLVFPAQCAGAVAADFTWLRTRMRLAPSAHAGGLEWRFGSLLPHFTHNASQFSPGAVPGWPFSRRAGYRQRVALKSPVSAIPPLRPDTAIIKHSRPFCKRQASGSR